jgi:U3 small nucleolar RNA-associated protein MPP10
MGGEAAAPVRPENSLLAEDLDFISGVRETPVITEAVSKNLEDIIKQRVKDQAWDDVQRKVSMLFNQV